MQWRTPFYLYLYSPARVFLKHQELELELLGRGDVRLSFWSLLLGGPLPGLQFHSHSRMPACLPSLLSPALAITNQFLIMKRQVKDGLWF